MWIKGDRYEKDYRVRISALHGGRHIPCLCGNRGGNARAGSDGNKPGDTDRKNANNSAHGSCNAGVGAFDGKQYAFYGDNDFIE